MTVKSWLPWPESCLVDMSSKARQGDYQREQEHAFCSLRWSNWKDFASRRMVCSVLEDLLLSIFISLPPVKSRDTLSATRHSKCVRGSAKSPSRAVISTCTSSKKSPHGSTDRQRRHATPKIEFLIILYLFKDSSGEFAARSPFAQSYLQASRSPFGHVAGTAYLTYPNQCEQIWQFANANFHTSALGWLRLRLC